MHTHMHTFHTAFTHIHSGDHNRTSTRTHVENRKGVRCSQVTDSAIVPGADGAVRRSEHEQESLELVDSDCLPRHTW
jgi:hypothetical protein